MLRRMEVSSVRQETTALRPENAMTRFCCVFFCRRAFIVCMLVWCCAGFFAAPASAVDPAPTPQKTRKSPSRNATTHWDFRAPDRSFQNVRWRESLSATLRQTIFAPYAPAGRSLRRGGGAADKGLPPVRPDEPDQTPPSESRLFMLAPGVSVDGEFIREGTGWRAYSDADVAGYAIDLKEERRVGVYMGFYPDEAVELQVGPEYHLGSSVVQPERTGPVKDSNSALGVGMKLKIDF
jgi:hypothetical protein